MPKSSITKIIDEKTGQETTYDMGKAIDLINTAFAKPPVKPEVPVVPNQPAGVSAQPAAAYNWSSMSAAEKENMLNTALSFNAKIEAESDAANKALYGSNFIGKYPKAATIWNPKTGTKKAVKLDQITGKIMLPDMGALPDDLNPVKGGNWALWTGGMASGQEAMNAITGQIVPIATVPTVPKDVTLTSANKLYKTTVKENEAYKYFAYGWTLGDSGKTVLDKQAALSMTMAAPTPVVNERIVTAPVSVMPPANITPPLNSIYINDAKQLTNLPGIYVTRLSDGRMYVDASKLKYLGTMAQVNATPANKRVLLNGKYYQVL